MITVVQKLAPVLKQELQIADEIWIASALITKTGLDYLLQNIPSRAKQHYIVGVDLPTEPKALKKLYNLSLTGPASVTVKLYSKKQFYHSKVYLIRNKNTYTAFLGSANCTIGGFDKNIEVSAKIVDRISCKHLLSWFEDLNDESVELLNGFINKYALTYGKRRKREYAEVNLSKNLKKIINNESDSILSRRERFLKVLKRYRKNPRYAAQRNERNRDVRNIRESLDYPDFNNIDVDRFYSIEALGNLIPILKPSIKRKIRRFSALVRMLCDESINIETRYNNAVTGNFKVPGVNEGIITKILTAHDPKNYFVKNKKSVKALKRYGLQLPRGANKGQKYVITANILKQVCKETKINDLAVLDYFLYQEGNIY